jgi:hypothetical protein
MRAFKYNLSFYLLPVFFFVLAVSPNISGDRIGAVLLSVFILLMPASNYIGANPGKNISPSGDIKYSFIDFLSLFLFLAAIYMGWKIGWQFNLLQCLYLIAVMLFSRLEKKPTPGLDWFMARSVQGLILFAIIYVGLNQYGLNNLLRIHIFLFSTLSTLVVLTSLYIVNLREYYLINTVDIELKPVKTIIGLMASLWIAFTVFLSTTYDWQYGGYISLAIIPSAVLAVILYRSVKANKSIHLTSRLQWINIVLSTGLIIFYIYFFLDSTQVLQAILGGY